MTVVYCVSTSKWPGGTNTEKGGLYPTYCPTGTLDDGVLKGLLTNKLVIPNGTTKCSFFTYESFSIETQRGIQYFALR